MFNIVIDPEILHMAISHQAHLSSQNRLQIDLKVVYK